MFVRLRILFLGVFPVQFVPGALMVVSVDLDLIRLRGHPAKGGYPTQ
jgi:hypothetical protein